MKTKRRELTHQEWCEVGRLHREAVAAFLRIGGALLHAEPVRIYDLWAKVRHAVEHRGIKLSDVAYDQFGLDSQSYDLFRRSGDGEGMERRDYGWPHPASLRKRTLTREEWIVVGDDVKHLQRCLSEIGAIIQIPEGPTGSKRWNDLANRIGSLKAKLDGTICGQHPDWNEATRVLYGDPSGSNPTLLASLQMEPQA